MAGDIEFGRVEIVSAGDQRPLDPQWAKASFLAGYHGLTRTNRATGMDMWFRWCRAFGLDPLVSARRQHIEAYGLWLEEVRHLRSSSVHQRMTTVVMFYRHLFECEMVAQDPGRGVRLPRVRVDSTVPRVDAEALARLLRAAEPEPAEHLLICLLGLQGLRVSEAVGAQISGLGVLGPRRTLTVARKGGRRQTLPLPPTVAAAVDRAVGPRTEGPLITLPPGYGPMSRGQAYRIVKRLAGQAGIDRRVHPHALRHAYVTLALDSGAPLQNVQASAGHDDARTTMRYDNPRKLRRTRESLVSAV